MIITRTPFRISFAGGGTDLREFYSQEPGRVISTSINKYIYVVVKRQLGIVEHKYRINWSQVEFKDQIEDIDHPIVREALREFNIGIDANFFQVRINYGNILWLGRDIRPLKVDNAAESDTLFLPLDFKATRPKITPVKYSEANLFKALDRPKFYEKHQMLIYKLLHRI